MPPALKSESGSQSSGYVKCHAHPDSEATASSLWAAAQLLKWRWPSDSQRLLMPEWKTESRGTGPPFQRLQDPDRRIVPMPPEVFRRVAESDQTVFALYRRYFRREESERWWRCPESREDPDPLSVLLGVHQPSMQLPRGFCLQAPQRLAR